MTRCDDFHKPSGEQKQKALKYPDGSAAPTITVERCARCGTWARAGYPYFRLDL